MTTVAEIEAALALLNGEELKRVEAALEMVRQSNFASKPKSARVEAFHALKQSLALDARKVSDWKAAVQDARR